MKAAYNVFVCLVAVFALASVAGFASADTQELTVPAAGNLPVNLGEMAEGDLLTIDWTSSTSVSAILQGPSGYTKTYSTTTFGFDIITVPHDGSYILTFSNPSSTSATVTLNWDVSAINPVHEATNILTWLLIIAVIIIVAIVVIVVLVVVMGSKKKQQAAVAAQPAVVTPTTPGMCPICGAQTDTNAPFCAKCGAKFR